MSHHNTPVRELEWGHVTDWPQGVIDPAAEMMAITPFRDYQVIQQNKGGIWYASVGQYGTECRTLEEAQAACQADFQKRVNECLAEPKASGWRDIESAPRDGTPVIAWRADQGWFECRWERMGGLVPDGEECGDPDHEGWYHGEWGLLESDLRPTLWTLPPPPGQEEKKGY